MNIELSQVILNHGITFLVVVTAIILCVVAVYLIRLLKDLSVLTKNLNETSEILNNELKPTLQEVNETMRSINTIIRNTDEGVGNVKSGIATALTKTMEFSGNLFSGFVKGFMAVYSLFSKRR